MDDALLVHLLYATNELHRDHQHSLEIEVPLAGLEEVFERWSEQVHHHHMELLIWHRAVRANVVQARYAG